MAAVAAVALVADAHSGSVARVDLVGADLADALRNGVDRAFGPSRIVLCLLPSLKSSLRDVPHCRAMRARRGAATVDAAARFGQSREIPTRRRS